MIIGLTGTMGSGKGGLARYLEKKGFQRLIFSDVVNGEILKRGMEITRKNQQDVADELRRIDGNYLTKRLLEKVGCGGDAVLDGIRNIAEINFLRQQKGFVLIGVDADSIIRFNRVVSRGDVRDPKTHEEFLERDKKDRFSENPEGQQVNLCLSKADHLILNNNCEEEMFEGVERILIGLNK